MQEGGSRFRSDHKETGSPWRKSDRRAIEVIAKFFWRAPRRLKTCDGATREVELPLQARAAVSRRAERQTGESQIACRGQDGTSLCVLGDEGL